MVAGHLREQNGYFQMILSWKGKDGKRKSKSISTGLQVKGNKKRAEALLLKTRKEFNPDNLLENSDMLFTEFLSKWLKDNAAAMTPNYFATVSYDTMATIIPYFEKYPIRLLELSAKEIENFYRYERKNNEANPQDLLQYHDAVKSALGYAVEIGWLNRNPAEQVNPCTDEAPILFTDFILE